MKTFQQIVINISRNVKVLKQSVNKVLSVSGKDYESSGWRIVFAWLVEVTMTFKSDPWSLECEVSLV